MQSDQLALVGPRLTRPMAPTPFPQIAVDAGVRFAHQPVAWMGDGDSGKPNDPATAVWKKSQDETDLQFCLHQIEGGKWTQLHLYGFLGGRKDQELAALGDVCHAVKKHALCKNVIFYDEALEAKIHLYPSGWQAVCLKGLFSILVLEPSMMTITGECEYSMHEQMLLPLSGRGVSNQGRGEVHVESSAPFLVVVEK